jgi:hypothetical protein
MRRITIGGLTVTQRRVALWSATAFFLSALFGCTAATQSTATDPQAVMSKLLSDSRQDYQQRRADDQQQRLLEQREQGYDRQKCIEVGRMGPDIEQCVRDSGLYRRGYRSGENTGGQSRPTIECTTVGDEGVSDTLCR